MFTGIVQSTGVIETYEEGDPLRLGIFASIAFCEMTELGASIACDGVCLTVINIESSGEGKQIFFEVGPTTVELTTLGHRREGDLINLERSLRVGDEIGGHLVSGHVDAVTHIIDVQEEDGCRYFRLAAPLHLLPYIAPQGSVSLDGTSLTVVDVEGFEPVSEQSPDPSRRPVPSFRIMMIPHSLEITKWDRRKVGDVVNLEVDVISRYVVHALSTNGGR